jgi:hypothetical protein
MNIWMGLEHLITDLEDDDNQGDRMSIKLLQDSVQWQALVSEVLNLCVMIPED